MFMRRAGSILPPLLRKGGAFYAKGCKTLYAHIRTSYIPVSYTHLDMKTLAIVGGGASGMLAGITALETNPDIQVIIFDQKDILGKKILSTGNGRCNLTNKNMSFCLLYTSRCV